LKIIEFKGIGLDKSNNIEQITKYAYHCIQELTSKNIKRDNNELIHCIWYLISGVRIDPLEFNLLKKLNENYNDKNIPIIIVYNNGYSEDCALEMKKIITKSLGNIDFVEIQPIEDKIFKSNIKKPAFGGKELKEKTLQKCSKALESELIELMTKAISESVKKGIEEKNNQIVENINKFIEKEINNYKKVLTDDELKNYVVNLFKESIYHFYKGYNEQISNQTLEILNKSSIINNIKNFINYYKTKFDEIIKPKLDEISKILINEQANKEKNSESTYVMRVEFRRNLDKFKETTAVFFKRNYYYAAQKYLIIKIKETVLKKFIENYRIRLDEIVNILLNDKNKTLITNNLQKCFLTKLKNFAISNGVNITIDDKEIILDRDIYLNKSRKIEELPPAEIKNNSIDLINNFDIDEIKETKKDIELSPNEENWLSYKSKEWKYLTEKIVLELKQFLEKDILYQEKFFEPKKNEKEVFKLLKEYEKNELIKFFNKNYKTFIKLDICKKYDSKYIHINRHILNYSEFKKIFEEIYIKKLNNTIDAINSDSKYYMIKYLTIVVIGRSGIGKSTLINKIIKENKAETGIGDKVTKVNSLYDSNFIPFLKLWDTRGIELKEQYGPTGILNNTLNIINNAEKNNDFNDLVSCIWYCVSFNYIDDKEIEIIKNLRKKKPSIPLIIVYTFAVSTEGFKTVLNKILEEFPNEIIIPVLAKKSGSTNSFGLDTLVNKTIELCKKELIKGIFYIKMRHQLSKYIEEKVFKIEHEIIKNKVINSITKYFIKDFKNVLNDEQLYDYIYNFFGNIILEYLTIGDLKEKNQLIQNIKKYLKDISNIPEYLPNFINNYKMKTKKLVDSIKDKMALDFIDKQVYFEKKKNKSIDKINKCNIDDFIKIIENFLNDNFYYISQKYLIYRVITEPCTDICTNIDMNVTKLVNNLLNKNSCDFLQKIYYKKFENYEKTVNTFKINGKIYFDDDLNQTMNEMIASMKDYSSAPAAIPNL
jgi:hypothetical protein